MSSTAWTASMAPMNITASFHQKHYWSWWLDHPWHQNDQNWYFLWNGSSKIHFLLISDTLAVRGCWGQQMLLFWELVDKTQMSKPLEHTRHHDSRQLSILLPLRAIYFSTFQYETPCMMSFEMIENFWVMINSFSFLDFKKLSLWICLQPKNALKYSGSVLRGMTSVVWIWKPLLLLIA